MMKMRLRRRVGLALLGWIAAVAVNQAQGQPVIYVDASASGANDGSSWPDAYTDLQDALGAAVAGDEIWVKAGTYTPEPPGGDLTASFQLISGVGLYGGFAGGETSRAKRDWVANETSLSGDVGQDDVYGNGAGWYQTWNRNTANSGHVVVGSGTDNTAVIDGFTIRDGATGPQGTPAESPLMHGSGMYNISGSPTINNCVFRYNVAGYSGGAAIYNFDSSPIITNCTFMQNYVHENGGAGMKNSGNSGPTISDCLFKWNRCVAGSGAEAFGGGIDHWTTTPLTVTRCTFDENTCTNLYPQGSGFIAMGAGIATVTCELLTVRDCRFTNNWAHAGGGIYTYEPTIIINSLFAGNTVVAYDAGPFSLGGHGGGIASGSSQADTTNLINCVFVNNNAGEGGGVSTFWNSHTVAENCILWGNTATGEEVTTRQAQIKGSSDILYSCVQGLLEPIKGEDPPDPEDYPGSFDDDPLLVDLPGGDVHLSPGSPCIDAGDNAAVPPGVTTDLDGNPRFVDDPETPDTGNPGSPPAPVVDIGVYEFGAGGPPIPTLSEWALAVMSILVLAAGTLACRRRALARSR